MNKVVISGVITELSGMLEVDGKEADYVCTFVLSVCISGIDGINVSCCGLLGKNIAASFKNNDTVTVIGKLGSPVYVDKYSGEIYSDCLGILADAVISGSDEVYPSTYPKKLALTERDEIERQEELSRIVDEISDPENDPF